LRYELPSPPAPLPRERGAFNSCPLSLGERARVRANLAIHTRIQQRRNFAIYIIIYALVIVNYAISKKMFTKNLNQLGLTQKLS
jgi:hypothetical protein